MGWHIVWVEVARNCSKVTATSRYGQRTMANTETHFERAWRNAPNKHGRQLTGKTYLSYRNSKPCSSATG